MITPLSYYPFNYMGAVGDNPFRFNGLAWIQGKPFRIKEL